MARDRYSGPVDCSPSRNPGAGVPDPGHPVFGLETGKLFRRRSTPWVTAAIGTEMGSGANGTAAYAARTYVKAVFAVPNCLLLIWRIWLHVAIAEDQRICYPNGESS